MYYLYYHVQSIIYTLGDLYIRNWIFYSTVEPYLDLILDSDGPNICLASYKTLPIETEKCFPIVKYYSYYLFY